MPDTIAYKVLTTDELAALERDGRFAGSPADIADGYIHLSTADQLAGTLDRHFVEQDGLQLAAIDLAALGGGLKWEASRGGQSFPHLYDTLLLETVIAYGPLEHAPDGAIRLPVAG